MVFSRVHTWGELLTHISQSKMCKYMGWDAKISFFHKHQNQVQCMNAQLWLSMCQGHEWCNGAQVRFLVRPQPVVPRVCEHVRHLSCCATCFVLRPRRFHDRNHKCLCVRVTGIVVVVALVYSFHNFACAPLQEARVNLLRSCAEVRFDPDATGPRSLIATVDDLGFECSLNVEDRRCARFPSVVQLERLC